MKKAKLFLFGAAIMLVAGTAVAVKANNRSTRNIGYCPAGKCVFANYNNLGIGTQTTVTESDYVTSPTIGATCTLPSDCGTTLTSPIVYQSN